MIYDRNKQWQFLEDELAAQVQGFDEKLQTRAIHLLEKGEVFTAQFLSFSESGEMRVRFAVSRPIPRKGEYLYCMTLHKELRNHFNWGELTYGDLVKDKTSFSQVICNWLSPSNDPNFMLAGFIGVDVEFFNWIRDTPGVVLVMGPQTPPYEYLANLQSIVKDTYSTTVQSILDLDFYNQGWTPSLIPESEDISGYIRSNFQLSDALIIQGPPGTGKTYQLANLCRSLCSDGKSVLVTALTNRALMELAKKDALSGLVSGGRVYKTKITTDEAKEVPGLILEKEIKPKPGCVVLSTFYISSGFSAELTEDFPFDYVIVDEASQALLPMIAAARRLGQYALFVGDIRQLPPVVELNEDRIERKQYRALVDGLKTITERAVFPVFQLTVTWRFSATAAEYTGVFYSNTLLSRSSERYGTAGLPFLREDGGPTLITTDMAIHDSADESCIALATFIVKLIHERMPKVDITVLTCLKNTVRALQKSIRGNIRKENILIDTVARTQGMTTPICIYVLPKTHYLHSLEPRLFNVATSRATNQTLIIADKGVLSYSGMEDTVRQYLTRVNREASFYVPARKKGFLLEDAMLLPDDSLLPE